MAVRSTYLESASLVHFESVADGIAARLLLAVSDGTLCGMWPPKSPQWSWGQHLGWLPLAIFITSLLAPVSPTLGGEAFDVWQVEDNPGQQKPITTILQSRDGYLWLGTYHGLVRFDGVRSIVFDLGNTPGLQNGLITSLFESADGVLWIGHETGQLTRLVNGRFEPVTLPAAWPGGTLENITADEQGAVWLINDEGVLFRLSDGRLAVMPGHASPTRKVALARAPTGGKPWLVCAGNVAVLEHTGVRQRTIEGSSPGDYFERVVPSRDGGLWILGNGRLRKWRAGQWVTELKGCPSEPGLVSTLIETRSGAVLAGTLRNGLYQFTSDGQVFHFSRTNGLSHDWVRSLCEDREGNIWVGTAAGLDGLRARKVQMLNAPDSFAGCGVLGISLSGSNSAWIGTEGAGLYNFNHGGWTVFNQTNGVSNLFVWSVLETRNGGLFVGTWGGGLEQKVADHFEPVPGSGELTAPVVCLSEGNTGQLLIGTTIGLYQYESGKLSFVVGKESLAFPDVRAVVQSADGTLWLGMSGGGLGRVQGTNVQQFTKQGGLGSDFVVCLYLDKENVLWIGTSDNGITRYKNGRFGTIGTKQGLPSSVICQITEDETGHLWISSHGGILRADKSELNRCADGAVPSVYWLRYGKAEGLSTLTCSGGFQPGFGRGSDGRIWFPTAKGVAIVNPANVTSNTYAPPVIIEELLVEGHAVDLHPTAAPDSASPDRSLEVSPGKRQFEIRYTGLSFISPDKVQFRHRLVGLEDHWIEAGTQRVAEYSYLRPGHYRFQVTACNNDGFWNPTGASLSFIVLPFFWQTWWFQIITGISMAALLAGGAFWISRRRVRLRLERSERQHALERERARIARDIHDDLGASLTRITMLSQSVRAELDAAAPAAGDVDQIYTTARELTRAMDEIVWAVNPKHDTLDSLVTYLGRFAQQFLSAAGVRCRLDVPVYLPAAGVTSEVRHNLFLALKEALHNVVNHARATEVRLTLKLDSDRFTLCVADNGKGFSPNTDSLGEADAARLSSGNGLPNMRKRLEGIGGQCILDTAPGEGTRVQFVIKTHDS
jgi:signal transduction histidine kinase/ligand-binding sensor domain-containing protein